MCIKRWRWGMVWIHRIQGGSPERIFVVVAYVRLLQHFFCEILKRICANENFLWKKFSVKSFLMCYSWCVTRWTRVERKKICISLIIFSFILNCWDFPFTRTGRISLARKPWAIFTFHLKSWNFTFHRIFPNNFTLFSCYISWMLEYIKLFRRNRKRFYYLDIEGFTITRSGTLSQVVFQFNIFDIKFQKLE